MQSDNKSKKITKIDPKYLPPKPDENANWSEDPDMMQFLVVRAANMQKNEHEAKLS